MKEVLSKELKVELFRTSIKTWTCRKKDYKKNDIPSYKEMSKVYKKDREDLRKVLKFYIANEMKKAGKKAYWLDTVVRDVIPCPVYDEIMVDI